jgi:YnbE-like lipoprotein
MNKLKRTGSVMLGRYRMFGAGAVLWLIWIVLTACQPRVALEAPKDPIVINLNVKIEHEVRVKIDRELEDVFEQNPELFGQ